MTGWCHRLLVGGRLAASPPPDPAAATKEAACDQGGSLDEAAAVFEEECVVHTVPAAGSPSTRPPYLASPNPSNTLEGRRSFLAAAALNPPPLPALPSSSPVYLVIPVRRSAERGLSQRCCWPWPAKFLCRRAKNAGYDDYKFPDPIPKFTEQEMSKFREHMAWRLEQKKEDYFREHINEIVDICSEILGSFLENDYCRPGMLLVHPFLDMKGEIKERGLPGAPQATRAVIAWAEKNIDKDWKTWTTLSVFVNY